MMPICIILLICLACHVYFIAYQFEACLHCLTCLCIVLKCASRCKQHVPVTCPACIFLSVTPFGVCLICILTSFSCTLCLCHCLLLLTNLKYGLGQNSDKPVDHRAVLSVMPCLGLHPT